MSDINITTNGTIQGTVLKVDGKDETAENKIVSISLWASAPYKSKYSGEKIPGNVSCSYEYADDKGTIERKTIGTCDTDYCHGGVGEKMESDDSVVRHLGKPADKEIVDLVDKILAECEKTKTKCPDKDVLLSRDLTSLKDKATDLGLKLEDAVIPPVTTETKPEGETK